MAPDRGSPIDDLIPPNVVPQVRSNTKVVNLISLDTETTSQVRGEGSKLSPNRTRPILVPIRRKTTDDGVNSVPSPDVGLTNSIFDIFARSDLDSTDDEIPQPAEDGQSRSSSRLPRRTTISPGKPRSSSHHLELPNGHDRFSSSEASFDDQPLRASFHSASRTGSTGGPSRPRSRHDLPGSPEHRTSESEPDGLDADPAVRQWRHRRALSHPHMSRDPSASGRSSNYVEAFDDSVDRTSQLKRVDSTSTPATIPNPRIPSQRRGIAPHHLTPAAQYAAFVSSETPTGSRLSRLDKGKGPEDLSNSRRQRTISIEKPGDTSKRRSRDQDRRPSRPVSGIPSASRRATQSRPLSDMILPSTFQTLSLSNSYSNIPIASTSNISQGPSLRDLLSQVDIAGALQLVNTIQKQQQAPQGNTATPPSRHAALSVSSDPPSLSSIGGESNAKKPLLDNETSHDEGKRKVSISFGFGHHKKVREKQREREVAHQMERIATTFNERSIKSAAEREFETIIARTHLSLSPSTITRADACRHYIESRYTPIFEALEGHTQPPSLIKVAYWRRNRKEEDKSRARRQVVNSFVNGLALGPSNKLLRSDDASDLSSSQNASLSLRRYNSPSVSNIHRRNKRPSDWEVYPDDLAEYIASDDKVDNGQPTTAQDIREALHHVHHDSGSFIDREANSLRSELVPLRRSESLSIRSASIPPSPLSVGVISPRSVDSPPGTNSLRHGISSRIRMSKFSVDRQLSTASDAEPGSSKQPVTRRSSDSTTELLSQESDIDRVPSQIRRREPDSDAESSNHRLDVKSPEVEESTAWKDSLGLNAWRLRKGNHSGSLLNRSRRWSAAQSGVTSLIDRTIIGSIAEPILSRDVNALRWTELDQDEKQEDLVIEVIDYDEDEYSRLQKRLQRAKHALSRAEGLAPRVMPRVRLYLEHLTDHNEESRIASHRRRYPRLEPPRLSANMKVEISRLGPLPESYSHHAKENNRPFSEDDVDEADEGDPEEEEDEEDDAAESSEVHELQPIGRSRIVVNRRHSTASSTSPTTPRIQVSSASVSPIVPSPLGSSPQLRAPLGRRRMTVATSRVPLVDFHPNLSDGDPLSTLEHLINSLESAHSEVLVMIAQLNHRQDKLQAEVQSAVDDADGIQLRVNFEDMQQLRMVEDHSNRLTAIYAAPRHKIDWAWAVLAYALAIFLWVSWLVVIFLRAIKLILVFLFRLRRRRKGN